MAGIGVFEGLTGPLRMRSWASIVDDMFNWCRDDPEYRENLIKIGGLHEVIGRNYDDEEWRQWFKDNVNREQTRRENNSDDSLEMQ